jgi:hypothetical protein
MNTVYLLKRCDDIAEISAMMLVAARRDAWHEVEALKQNALQVIAEVRTHAASDNLSVDQRKIKHACMARILENEGHIRDLAEPWSARLSKWSRVGAADSNPPGGELQ